MTALVAISIILFVLAAISTHLIFWKWVKVSTKSQIAVDNLAIIVTIVVANLAFLLLSLNPNWLLSDMTGIVPVFLVRFILMMWALMIGVIASCPVVLLFKYKY